VARSGCCELKRCVVVCTRPAWVVGYVGSLCQPLSKGKLPAWLICLFILAKPVAAELYTCQWFTLALRKFQAATEPSFETSIHSVTRCRKTPVISSCHVPKPCSETADAIYHHSPLLRQQNCSQAERCSVTHTDSGQLLGSTKAA
jgi:hypothetical protein